MNLAGEARKPDRDVPLAIRLSLGICLAISLSLHLSFPPDQLTNGWHSHCLSSHVGLIVALTVGLGISWLVTLLLIDAVVSPGATSLTYFGVSARINWMMGIAASSLKLGQLNS